MRHVRADDGEGVRGLKVNHLHFRIHHLLGFLFWAAKIVLKGILNSPSAAAPCRVYVMEFG